MAGVLLLGLSAPVSGVHAETLLAPVIQKSDGDRVVFLVNNEAIFTKTFKDRLRFVCLSMGLAPSSETLSKLTPSVLRSMIDETLQRQWALKMGMTVEDKEVEETLQDIESGNKMSPGTFKKMLAQQNIPLDTFFNKVRSDLLWIRYLRAKYDARLVVTPQQKEALRTHLGLQQRSALYRIGEIVLYASRGEDQKVLQQMQQIREYLTQGAPFSAVAQQLSQSPSASHGGLRDWTMCGDLEEPVCQAVQRLSPGELSQPISIASGYVLIVLLDRKAAGQDAGGGATDQELEARLKAQVLEGLSRLELTKLRERIPVEIRLQEGKTVGKQG